MDEHNIIEGLRQGKPEAQEQLLQLYGEPLVRFLHYTLRMEKMDAEDTAVETLYKAIARIDQFKPMGDRSFRNWLFTIARNLRNDKVRKARKSILLEDEDYEQIPDAASAQADTDSPSFLIQALRDALAELPEKQRLTLLLHYDGLQLNEIAEILNATPVTVRQWKKRGLKALTEILKANPAVSDLVQE
jgi:RNA polymerase sigma-70 factor, ECF subfamily